MTRRWIAKLGDFGGILYKTEFEGGDIEEVSRICKEILEDYIKNHFKDIRVDELSFDNFSESNYVCVDVSIPACSLCSEKGSCNKEFPCRLTSKTFFIEAYPKE